MEKVTGDTCMAVLMIEEEGTLSEEDAYLQASYLHGLKCLQNDEEMESWKKYKRIIPRAKFKTTLR